MEIPHMNHHYSASRPAIALAAAAALVLTGLRGAPAAAGNPTDVDPEGEIEPREISWLLSRPADGGVITAMEQIADEYAAGAPRVRARTSSRRPTALPTSRSTRLWPPRTSCPSCSTPTRPPSRRSSRSRDRWSTSTCCSRTSGLADDYREAALNYQRFDDGSLYMVPFEFQLEFFWYNNGAVRAGRCRACPATLDDFAADVRGPPRGGHHPHRPRRHRTSGRSSVTWRTTRSVMAGPEYVQQLKSGEASFGDAPGRAAAEWLYGLGQAGCFQEGFSSTGYADAQALFTSGQAPPMYNIGTWELAQPRDRRRSTPACATAVDYFTLPTIEGAVTADNEYVTPSGHRHGGQLAAPTTRSSATSSRYALERYPEVYAATGALSPTDGVETDDPGQRHPAVRPGRRAGRRRRALRSRCPGTRSSTRPRTPACSRS